MSTVKLNQIASGMTLLHTVKNHRGQILAEAGQKITDKHMRVFKMWGITEVEIKTDHHSAAKKPEKTNIPPEIISKARQHVKNRFFHTDFNHPLVRSLAKINLNNTINYLMKVSGDESGH